MERKQLVVARLSKHWSQEQAAGFIGTDAATLSRWERGKTTPRPYHVQRLCEVYEKTAWELGLDAEQRVGEVPSRREQKEISIQPMNSAWNVLQNDVTMHMFVLVISNRRVTLLELDTLQIRLTETLEKMDRMNTENALYQMNRRQALSRIASLPLLALGLDISGPILNHPIEEILTQCAAGIMACGYLSRAGKEELSLATNALMAYLPTLKTIVQDSSQHRKAAAHLVSQDLLLLSTLTVHSNSARMAIPYAQQAVTYSDESDDLPLRLVALKRLGWIYACNRQFTHAAKVASSASDIVDTAKRPVPPSVLRLTYSGIAKAQSQIGCSDDAHYAMKMAFDSLHQGDEEPTYTDYNYSNLLLDAGLSHYHLGQYEESLNIFSQVIDPYTLKGKVAVSSERVRIEVINQQTLALLKMPKQKKDKELSIALWKIGIEGAKTLQSEQRFAEALRAYDMMEALWGDDRDISQLRDLTVHW